MDGVTIIGALLARASSLVAAVPDAQRKAGALADGTPMPSVLARSISETERSTLVRGGMVHIVERIAVTTRARNYREMVQVDRLAREACAGFVGAIAGAERVAVLAAGRGPDLKGPNDSFERTRDFRVAYDVAT